MRLPSCSTNEASLNEAVPILFAQCSERRGKGCGHEH